MPDELKHLKEIIELRFSDMDKALQIQAKEYERRLEMLNGEADRLGKMQATYLPREIYDTHHTELVNKIDYLQKVVFIGMGIIFCIQFLLKFLYRG